jgi:sorbitol-specific phosphotransferase system component IIBC
MAFKLARKHSHFLFAFTQSGLTSCIVTGITLLHASSFSVEHWVPSWLLAWAIVGPLALALAPLIRMFCDKVATG